MIKFELVDRLYALFPKLKKKEALAIVNLIVEKMADRGPAGIQVKNYHIF